MKHKINELPQGRFLLGFSGGVDSSALFFMLYQCGIEFDLAIVDYGVREQSALEVQYAQELARVYQKRCYVHKAPQIVGNFESEARAIRYRFFQEIVLGEGYAGVILAHQLNDRLEWFVMQMCRGAGLNTILGFDFLEKWQKISIYRPLLEVSRAEIEEYSCQNSIKSFQDASNQDMSFQRNYVRTLLAPLIQKHHHNIAQTLAYLFEDKKRLYREVQTHNLGDIVAFARSEVANDLHCLDQLLKQRGYVLSQKQRDEISRCDFECEIAGWVIASCAEWVWIAPKIKVDQMEKKFRESMRLESIPSRLRKNIYQLIQEGKIELDEVKKFFKI
ncbi:tRNA lysidine(34) synthetase TilS [Helicobacter enhydrae]|uniref:tRNA(Ile)-lysidine synthase n=1 Tax=Helicobacter enhydrae TaxID=222136 RepID=A0A1B1U5S4_9HELI|nr:tRNA lysidine(34) synthetase TilS [Helicobacter enhydrae]ANV98109.1 tRNA lysidine(34) synthetase TilS [Helicobacter enhydrae]